MNLMLIRSVIVAFYLFSLIYRAHCQQWTTYTDKSDIRDIAIYENDIWCASSGGVFKFNTIDSSYECFTNTNGLTSIDAIHLEVAKNGNVWVGFSNDYINIYDINLRQWSVINDFFGHLSNDFEFYNSSVFIAFDSGVCLYDLTDQEIKECYRFLGNDVPTEIPVNCICVHNNNIWIGTEYGIAKASLSQFNLMDPANWQNFTTHNSALLSNTINSIVALDSIIYIATDKGINKIVQGIWYDLSYGLISKNIISLKVKDHILYALTPNDVYKLNEVQWGKINHSSSQLSCFAIGQSEEIWVGYSTTHFNKGLSHYKQSYTGWKTIIPPGPVGNSFRDLAIDKNGILWCCTSEGISRFDGINWINYTKDNYPFNYNSFSSVEVDQFNNKWFGNWGGGLVQIDENKNITIYGSDYLSGIPGNPEYITVSDIKIDNNNNVWCTISSATDSNIAVKMVNDQWQYFSSGDYILNDNPDNRINGLTFDSWNQAWICSNEGIFVLDHKSTLMDKSDDRFVRTLTIIDGLSSNDVNVLKEDVKKRMWIGTSDGLCFWHNGFVYNAENDTTLLNFKNSYIYTIDIDANCRKWIGSDSGLIILSEENSMYSYFTVQNSPLTNANVTCFTFDYAAERVYMGTMHGLMCLDYNSSFIWDEGEFVKEKKILLHQNYPNPFNTSTQISYSIPRSDFVTLKILDIRGREIITLVSEIQKVNTYFIDFNAGDFSSGIYFYRLEVGENFVETKKMLFIK